MNSTNTSIIANTEYGTNYTSHEDLPSKSADVDITDVIVRCVFTPLFLAIGMAGNASTIIVFHRQAKRRPSGLFILALAYCDFCVLSLRFVAIIYSWLQMFSPETIRYVLPNSFFWINASICFQRTGSWFIIVIILERIIAVWFPLNLRNISTITRAKCITAFIFVVALTSTSTTIAVVLKSSINGDIPSTGPVSTQREAARYLTTRSEFIKNWQLVLKVVYDILPIPLVFILNILVIIGIRRSTGVSKKFHSARQKQEQKITITLLTIAIFYFIFCGPFTLYCLLTTRGFIAIRDVPNIVSEIFKMLVILNSTVNFIIYGVTDQSVRQDYTELWRCRAADNDTDTSRRSTSRRRRTKTKDDTTPSG